MCYCRATAQSWHRSQLSAVFAPGEATLTHWSTLWGAHTITHCEYFQISFSCCFIIHSSHVPRFLSFSACVTFSLPGFSFIDALGESSLALAQCLVFPHPMTDAKRIYPLYVIKRMKLLFSNEVWIKLVLLVWAFWLWETGQWTSDTLQQIQTCRKSFLKDRDISQSRNHWGKTPRLWWQQGSHANSLALILYSHYHNLSIDFTVPETKHRVWACSERIYREEIREEKKEKVKGKHCVT